MKKKSATFNIAVVAHKERIEGCFKLFPDLRVDTITNTGSLNGTLDQSYILKFFQVLRNGRLGQSEFLNQVPANAGIDFDKALNDGDSCRMSKGFHHGGQPVLFF